MKKIYFLVIACLFSLSGYGATWYFNGNLSTDMTILNNWSTTFPAASTTHPLTFNNPGDNWHVNSTPAHIGAGEVFSIAGSLIVEMGSHINKDQPNPAHIWVGGSFTMTDSAHVSTAVIGDSLYFHIYGHFSVNDSSYFLPTVSTKYFHIHFCDTGDVTGSYASAKNILWPSIAVSKQTSITIDLRSVRRVPLYNLPLPINPNVNDSLCGTLWCTNYNIIGGTNTAFYIADSALILTSNPGGMDSSIQMRAAGDSIWYSQKANYIFNGTAPQVTGFTMPDTITGPAVVPYLATNYGTVTINNKAGVTLSDSIDFETNGTLMLERGTFSNGSGLRMDVNSWLKLDSGSLAASPTYVFPVAVQYINLGPNLAVVTTGNEIIPTSSGTIGLYNIHKNGTSITLNSAPVVQTVQIDSLGDAVSGIPVLDASTSNYNITTNAWINQPGTGAFTARSGTVLFVPGTAPAESQITGATVFNGLTLNNSNHLQLNTGETVNGQLTLTAGNFYLNNDTLLLGPVAPAVAPGTFSNTNMIVDVAGAGEVIKQVTADGTFLFPIGDSLNYTPFTINFSGTGSYGTASFTGVTVTHHKQPNNANTVNFLKRFWTLDLSGTFTAPQYSVTTTYVPGDVNGNSSKLDMGQYTGGLTPWVRYDLGNPFTYTLTTGATPVTRSSPPNDFSGIDSTRPTVSINLTDTVLCLSLPLSSVTLDTVGTHGDLPLFFTWAPAAGLSTTVGHTVVATPTVTTVYTLTLTDGDGFTATATTTITVNPAPTLGITPTIPPITSNGPDLCYGDSLMLVGRVPQNVATYSWSGPVALSGATTDTAKVSSVTAAATGVYTIRVTNGPGIACAATYTYSVTEHNLPLHPTAGTSGTYCDTTTIFALGGTGTIYFEGNSDSGTSTLLSSPQVVDTTGTYFFRTHDDVYGCWGGIDSVKIVINPLPQSYPFVHPFDSAFCSSDTGLHVILASSDTGISYQLDTSGLALGTPLLGTGSSLDFGLKHYTGTFYVIATNTHTGCITNMTDTAHTYEIGLPADETMTLGGGYCIGGTGVNIGLSNSSMDSDNYYLYWNGVLIDSIIPGPGGALSFPNSYTAAGIYTVVAVDIYNGCIDTMSTHDSVWTNPLPNKYVVFGGGAFCSGGAGVNVAISGSDSGTIYQLLLDGVAAIGPIGPVTIPITVHDTLSFGAQTGGGLYTVQATSDYGCVDTMLDSAVVVVNPLPTLYEVFPIVSHDYCDYDTIPVVISLGGSDLGISYQLFFNGTPSGLPMAGTGSSINFGSFVDPGTYTISATDTTTLCNVPMTGSAIINVHPRPTIYTVSGAGAICSGSAGVDVVLSSQDAGVTYNLIFGGSTINSVTSSTSGSPLDFGLQTGMGTYTVIGSSAFTCTVNMAGSATVTVNVLPAIDTVTGGGAHCFPGTSFPVGLSGSQSGISYHLFLDSTTTVATHLGGTSGGSFSFGTYATPGNYTVVAINTTTGCTDTMYGFKTITIYPLPTVDTVSGNGIFCAGAPGSQVLLSGSQSGVNYVLYRDTISTPIESTGGTGGALNFGYQSLGGKYTVIATNTTTGCVNHMDSFALLIRHPLPAIYTIAGGGGYCVGDTGRPIYLDASNVGIRYNLFNGTLPAGVVYGTGFGIGYGTFTTIGTYSVVATDTATGCTSNMANTLTIGINSLPAVFNVSGGGTGCAGSAFYDTLSGSVLSVKYYLYNGTSTLFDSLTGTGNPLLFGTYNTSGTYTVIARDVYTECISHMTGSATINEIPLPLKFNITGGGSYCAGDSGVFLGLDSSQAGVNYQAVLGGLNIGGPRVGLGGDTINFNRFTLPGYYRIWALSTVAPYYCVDTMNGTKLISINLLPNQYTVTGGGTYCTLDTGLHIGLSNSDSGISYKLYGTSGLIGSPWAGDNAPLDFGLLTTAGTYTVTAVNTTTTCHDTMSGTATIVVEPIQVPVVTLAAFPNTTVTVGTQDTVVATIVSGGGINPTYQWLINNNPIYGATSDTLIYPVYFDMDSIVCQVTSEGLCGGVTTSQLIVIHLYFDAVPVVKTAAADIRLVPNPNTGVFSLKGKLGDNINEDATAEVTDMLGQVVYSSKIPVNNGMINEHIQLSGNLANGMYLLNLRSGTVSSVIHFVVAQ